MYRKEGNFSVRSDIKDDGESGPLDLYESFAKYYDKWYEDYDEDIEFYLKMAELAGEPVLVCMCGTGRVLIPLAEAGYTVMGVDRSPAMLDVCAMKIELLDEEIQKRIQIVQNDVRDFRTEMRFRLAIIPFNSFLHLIKTEDQEDALSNIREHLQDGGLLVLSVFNPDLSRPEEVVKHMGTKVTEEGEIISRFESQVFDHARQTTTVHYFYDISRQDRPIRRVTSTFTLRYMFNKEMSELLERCGFDVLEIYGDYDLTPFKKNSELMIFVARKV